MELASQKKLNSDFKLENFDFSKINFRKLAELLRFKQKLLDIFCTGTLGDKYLDLNKNLWGIVADTQKDYGHLIMRQKGLLEEQELH